MNFHHYFHYELSINDELLCRNEFFAMISSIIQNLSYHSDEYDNCLHNMLFMIMLDAYLSDLLLLLQKIYLIYHKTYITYEYIQTITTRVKRTFEKIIINEREKIK